MPERWLTIVVCALAQDGGQSGRRSYPQRFYRRRRHHPRRRFDWYVID